MINLVSIPRADCFPGTRHATDPHHVMAVTTMVTRQKTQFSIPISTAAGVEPAVGKS